MGWAGDSAPAAWGLQNSGGRCRSGYGLGILERKRRGGGALPHSLSFGLSWAGCAEGRRCLQCPPSCGQGWPLQLSLSIIGSCPGLQGPHPGTPEGLAQPESRTGGLERPGHVQGGPSQSSSGLRLGHGAWLSSVGLATASGAGCRDPGTQDSPREAAPITPGRAPCPAAGLLAGETLLTWGGGTWQALRGAGWASLASPHVVCRGASCGSFLSTAWLRESGWQQGLLLGNSLQSSGWKPETAAGAACPGQGSITPSPATRVPGAPAPSPEASGRFLRRSRGPCRPPGPDGVGAAGRSVYEAREPRASAAAGQVSSHGERAGLPGRREGGGRRRTPSLGSGFSREIEAHCWRLSHGVSQGEQRPLGAQAPRFIWGSPGGFRKMSPVGQIRFDSGLGTWVSDPRWPLEQSQEGGLSPAALDGGPERPQRPPRDIGRRPAPHLRTWARAWASGLCRRRPREQSRRCIRTLSRSSAPGPGA